MRIQKINNYTTFQQGLYFTRVSNVLFSKNPEIKYQLTDPEDIVQVSETGARYLEDKQTSQEVKDKIAKIPFIDFLSKNFDTFVLLTPPRENFSGPGFYSYIAISWADYSKKYAQRIEILGNSDISKEDARNDLFKKLQDKGFQMSFIQYIIDDKDINKLLTRYGLK